MTQKIKSLKLKKEFQFGKIINERPKGMSFEHYKLVIKSQSKRLKSRLRGGFKLN